MTLQPDHVIPLPPGADPDDLNNFDWQDADSEYPAYRVVGRTISTVDDNDIRCLVVQWGDGTIATDDHDGPRVYVGMADYAPAEARTFAAALTEAADLADQWTGTNTGLSPVELLANAFSALRTAHSLLRVLPGNADSYVLAALDSISDAVEVLR